MNEVYLSIKQNSRTIYKISAHYKSILIDPKQTNFNIN